jgi:hypothetical protein
MGFFIAILVLAATALTANHMGHLQEHNQVLTQKVQVLESQTDGQNLHIDGVAVRNLSDEK